MPGEDSSGVRAAEEASLPRIVTARTGREHYRTALQAGVHTLEVDEPESVGGQDTGPTPFDLLCAALAACTTITVRMYVDRKGWTLEEIAAQVEHSRVAAPDGEGRPTDQFTVTLELSGELDEHQRARIIEIAGRCPVHRTLVAGSIVEMRA